MQSVPNLKICGYRYQWRSRLPKSLTIIAKKSHLCLALKTADYSIASRIALRLNELKLSLSMYPSSNRTGEALQLLFEAERDKFFQNQSDHAFTSRARRIDHVAEKAADIAAGWAYWLIAQFGTGFELTFESGSAQGGGLEKGQD